MEESSLQVTVINGEVLIWSGKKTTKKKIKFQTLAFVCIRAFIWTFLGHFESVRAGARAWLCVHVRPYV